MMGLIGAVIAAAHPRGAEIASLSPRFRQPPKRYPEQSSRQAMRAHRRAQGGPGIVLDQSTHRYKAAIPHDLWF